MIKFLLIALLINKGAGAVDYAGMRPFADLQTCEEFISMLPEAPITHRLIARGIPIEKFDTTEARVD